MTMRKQRARNAEANTCGRGKGRVERKHFPKQSEATERDQQTQWAESSRASERKQKLTCGK